MSCGGGDSGIVFLPPVETPNTVQFDSDRIHVEKTATGEMIVRFHNISGDWETKQWKSGDNPEIYNQDGIRVTIKNNEAEVELVTPYTNALGSLGASTLTVYSDYTAIEVLDSDGIYDYRFYFADSGTGELAYEARLIEEVINVAVNAVMTVETRSYSADFAYPDGGSALGNQDVTVTYNADSSRMLSFSNPYGSGRAGIAYTTPVRYADVVGTAFYNTRLHVYVKTDGKYIVDYYAVSGKRMYSQEVDPTVANPNLYQDSAVTLSVLADNTLKMVEPSGLGIHEYALNPAGLAAEHDSSTGTNMYSMHFMDAKSGLVKDTGTVTLTVGVWTMEFPALGYSAPIGYGTDPPVTIITYSTSYNHAQLGAGMFDIVTSSTGVINATDAVITAPHP